MKKAIFRAAVSVITFSIGLGVFVLIYFYYNSVPEVPTPKLLPADCAKSKSYPGLSQKISELKKGKSGYFVKDTFSGRWEKRDDFINDWYGKHLRAMGEKSLLDVSEENAEIYRFLWLRTFHHPIFVRIERKQDEIKLFTKELNGAGGYEPRDVLRSDEITLKQEDFCRFLSLIEKAGYWQMPMSKNEGALDGAQWILEGVKDGRYHIVDRFSPEGGEYREACLYLLKLSGVETDRLKDDLY